MYTQISTKGKRKINKKMKNEIEIYNLELRASKTSQALATLPV